MKTTMDEKLIARYEGKIGDLKRRIVAIDLQKQVAQAEIDKITAAIAAIKLLDEPVTVPMIPVPQAGGGAGLNGVCLGVTGTNGQHSAEEILLPSSRAADDGRGILESAG